MEDDTKGSDCVYKTAHLTHTTPMFHRNLMQTQRGAQCHTTSQAPRALVTELQPPCSPGQAVIISADLQSSEYQHVCTLNMHINGVDRHSHVLMESFGEQLLRIEMQDVSMAGNEHYKGLITKHFTQGINPSR